ncbi:2115_t:CDS:2 [Paraglomus brasilianum]|uniref:2115_t:CDS:1 n=1 Tax=Paraglomus brasilianum TaxID=144538 RepID=A0A9N9AML1_9GLOM|nr:2115_t:CDS:2 [Paraglomus brasilianum]
MTLDSAECLELAETMALNHPEPSGQRRTWQEKAIWKNDNEQARVSLLLEYEGSLSNFSRSKIGSSGGPMAVNLCARG